MDNLILTLIPFLGMFLGIFSIVRYYFNKLEKRIDELELRLNKIENK
ncbi:MAG: hypothetical protein RR620_08320 [Clostridium sp.]